MRDPLERSRTLDVLRGVAILGILPANVPWYALPAMAEPEKGFAYHLTRFLFDYKFITLFSLLFGIGMAVLRRRAEATGRPYARIMLRRLSVLWVLGILHATLLWYGDIVSYYAPLGLALFWVSGWQPRTLAILGAILLAVPALAMVVLAPVLHVYRDAEPVAEIGEALEDELRAGTAPPGAATGSWDDFLEGVASFDPAFETEVYRDGSFARITILRTLTWILGFLDWGWYMGWRIAGLFLLGMALGKTEWLFDPGHHALRRAIAWGLALGIPIQAAGSIANGAGWGGLAGGVAAELAQYTGSLGLSAAYAALVALAVRAGSVPRALRLLEGIGRTAFSNYLFQSLVSTTIFYSYGFALFGRLDRLELLAVVAGVWALQLALTGLWLARFGAGPAEWLWRSATYWEIQPLRKPR